MINAVLWDLGGVLCHFRPLERTKEFARRSGRSTAAVEEVITPRLRNDLDIGAVNGGELHRLVRNGLGWDCSYGELGEAWAKAFQPDPAVLALLARLRVPSALLTDNGSPLSDDFARLLPTVARLIKVVVFSADLGVTKPAPAAFLAACRRVGTAPERTLFVDDNATNVAGAQSAGLVALRYIGAVTLERALQEFGLLD